MDAQALAESGLDQAVATLANSADPTSPGALADGSSQLGSGRSLWSGVLSGSTWTIRGAAIVANPSGASDVSATAGHKVRVGLDPDRSWNTLYADNDDSSCTTLRDTVTIGGPLAVRDALCLQNSARVTSSVRVGDTVTTEHLASIGSSDQRVPDVHVANGCRNLKPALVFASNRHGTSGSALQLYTMNGDGTRPTRLTANAATDDQPEWSPDGKKIAFFSRRAGTQQVFVMNADGSEETNLTRREGADSAPAWRPDGKKILFVSDRDGKGLRLHVMDANGDNVELLPAKESPSGMVIPAWSPDGKQIAYSDRIGDAVEIFTCDADGKNPKRLTMLGGFNTFPAWSRDGKRIALQHWDNQEAPGSLWVVDVKDGVQTNLGHTGAFMVGRPAWKP